ncbi:hypothetical protein P9X10_02595 [Bacillus cereus]|nr:hypothetical protein [Bacillus cereus]
MQAIKRRRRYQLLFTLSLVIFSTYLLLLHYKVVALNVNVLQTFHWIVSVFTVSGIMLVAVDEIFRDKFVGTTWLLTIAGFLLILSLIFQ